MSMSSAKNALGANKKRPPRLDLVRRVALLSFLILFALLLIWNLGYANIPNSLFWAVLTLQILPLLLLAPGMIKGTPRHHAWACFAVNLYFIQGVLAAFDPSKRLFGWLEILLSLSLFISATLYIRWCTRDTSVSTRRTHRRPNAEKSSPR
jgi:uncharacterized membrane protein